MSCFGRDNGQQRVFHTRDSDVALAWLWPSSSSSTAGASAGAAAAGASAGAAATGASGAKGVPSAEHSETHSAYIATVGVQGVLVQNFRKIGAYQAGAGSKPRLSAAVLLWFLRP